VFNIDVLNGTHDEDDVECWGSKNEIYVVALLSDLFESFVD